MYICLSLGLFVDVFWCLFIFCLEYYSFALTFHMAVQNGINTCHLSLMLLQFFCKCCTYPVHDVCFTAKWMEKAFLHMEDERQLKDKNQDLQAKYDELYKQVGSQKKMELGKLFYDNSCFMQFSHPGRKGI